MAYQKTTWIDHVTPITAERLNNMEGGIENALSKDELQTAAEDILTQAKESGAFDGPAGATPVKGTDYYTEADKAEMVDLVLAALPMWAGGDY